MCKSPSEVKAPTKPTEFVTHFPLDEYNTAPQDGITHYIPRWGIQGTDTLPLSPAYVWEDSALTKPSVNSQHAENWHPYLFS